MARNTRVLGKAGGGLDNASWAANASVARVGQAGEVKTAKVLEGYAEPEAGVTVLHDLMLPSNNGMKANIDHVVVSGSTVHLIDAKVWKPAFYWTVRGKTRRGLEAFPHADKKTMSMAVDMISGYLKARGLDATITTPLIVVWPSSSRRRLRTWALRVPGARAMTGPAFEAWARSNLSSTLVLGLGTKRRTADPEIVSALATLLTSKG